MKRKAITLVGFAAILTGCTTNKDLLNAYEEHLLAGEYAKAAEVASEPAADEGKDQLLWRLHEGSAFHLAQQDDKAKESFDQAEDIFIRNDNQSVFRQGSSKAVSMMSNDRVFPFAGGGQDRIFTCLYKAVDYGAAQDLDAVRTELNRAAQHQENWLFDRRKEIEAAREKLNEDAAAYAKENQADASESQSSVQAAYGDASFVGGILEGTQFNPATDGNLDALSQKDYLNVYVQHVCGVFRWLSDGSGADYFKGLPELRPENKMLLRDAAEGAGGKPTDQVWVYVEDGLGPCREEWRLDLPVGLIPHVAKYVVYTGMALPKLRERAAAHSTYDVTAGGAAHPMEVLQDVDALVKVEYDVYMRGALQREITRAIVRAGVQAAIGIAVDKADNAKAKWILRASHIASAAWAASVTQADLRSWTALPKRVLACRIDRPADGVLVLRGDGAEIAKVVLPKGNSMVFVSRPSPQAKAVVKAIAFP